MTRSYLQRLADRISTPPPPLPRVVPDVPRGAPPGPGAEEPFEAVAPLVPPATPSAQSGSPAPIAPPQEALRGRTVVVPPVPAASIERGNERRDGRANERANERRDERRDERGSERGTASPAPRAVVVPAARPPPREPSAESPTGERGPRGSSEVEPFSAPRASAPRESPSPGRAAPRGPSTPDVSASDLWAELERRAAHVRAPVVEPRVERVERIVAPDLPVAAPTVLPAPTLPAIGPVAAAPKLTIGRIRVEVVAPPPAPRAPATVSRVVVAAPHAGPTSPLLLGGVFGLGQS